MSLLLPPMKIVPRVQDYAWGSLDPACVIRRFLEAHATPERCAELWIGAHKKAPALLEFGAELIPMDKAIEQFGARLIGSRSSGSFGQVLPFLCKILSVQEPLSIQLHPSLEDAERLHKLEPQHYPDANHKPEVGIALRETQLLYGFRTEAEIRSWCELVPELNFLLGEVAPGLGDAAYRKQVYSALMRAPAERVVSATGALRERYLGAQMESETEAWAQKALGKYPDGERGIFAFYLLNLITLQPNQAIFIGPHIPHAYLSGELFECMASSDNVVRAGLTEKFQDIETLLSLADFSVGMPQVQSGISRGTFIEYAVPAAEFDVFRIDGDCVSELLPLPSETATIFCVLEGRLQLETAGGSLQCDAGQLALLPAESLPLRISSQAARAFAAFVPATQPLS